MYIKNIIPQIETIPKCRKDVHLILVEKRLRGRRYNPVLHFDDSLTGHIPFELEFQNEICVVPSGCVSYSA